MTVEPAPRGGWIRRLGPFLAAHKGKVAIALGVAVVGQVVIALTPVIEKVVIDDVITSHDQPLWPWIALLIGAVGGRIRRRVHPPFRRWTRRPRRAVRPAQRDLRTAAAARLRAARRAADRPARVASEQRPRSHPGAPLVHADHGRQPRAWSSVSLVVMLVLSPLLTLDRDPLHPRARSGCRCGSGSRCSPRPGRRSSEPGRSPGVVDEAVSGVRVVKGFGQEDRELHHLTETSEVLFRSTGPDGPDAGPAPVGAADHPGARAGRRPRASAGGSRSRATSRSERSSRSPATSCSSSHRCGCSRRCSRSASRPGPAPSASSRSSTPTRSSPRSPTPVRSPRCAARSTSTTSATGTSVRSRCSAISPSTSRPARRLRSSARPDRASRR